MMELSLLDWTLWLMKVTKAVLNLHHIEYQNIQKHASMQLVDAKKEGLQ